jgi:NADH:ubiquinone oxidoreductase subunit 4 (subunit M)
MGALSVVWGAFAGAARDDLKGLASSVTEVNAGISLFAIGSLTAIGLEGAVAAMHSQILYSVLVFGIGVPIEARFASTDLRRVCALAAAAPLMALIVAIAGLSQLGAPGSYAFVARMLSIVGAVPLRPMAALAVVLGLLVVAVAGARRMRRVLAVGEKDSPDASGRASAGDFGPLAQAVPALAALAVVTLGLWPKPALSAVSTSALEHAARVNPPGPLEIVDRPGNRPRQALARALPSFHPVVTRITRLSEARGRPLLATCAQAKP